MGLEFSTETIEFESKRLYGALVELGNAVFALFWEGEQPRLGTLTVTLPNRVSYPLLGEKNRILGQLLSEQLASIFGKMALVSTNLPTPIGNRVGRTLLDLVKGLSGKKAPRG
jgi:hypothetical protein